MSAFSSLIIFYPGTPPRITVRELRAFCDRLRETLSLRDSLLAVDIKYGKSIDQDFDSTNKIDWEETGTSVGMGTSTGFPWDHEERTGSWAELWPKPAYDSRVLYRAYIGLGSLPCETSRELTAMKNRETTYEFIAPDTLSLQIDPVRPETLDGKALDYDCYGFIGLSFAGNGFFTWQPLPKYWESAQRSPTISTVLTLCREAFPVPRLDVLPRMKDDLGDLFLNREEYQDGDWVVSVRETG